MFLTRILTKLSQPPRQRQNIDYESLLPLFEFDKGIRKCIVQTCKETSRLPDEIKNNISMIQDLNPGWDYVIFENNDIEEFILKKYGPDILNYFRRISNKYGAAKADFFRYLYLYSEGGVYLDIKSSTTLSLDSVLREDDSFILSFWDNQEGDEHCGTGHYSESLSIYTKGEIPQWFIISSKGHPILRDIIIRILRNIDNYNPYVDGIGWGGTVYTTGPVPYSLCIYENIGKYPHREVDKYTDIGLVYSIFESKHGVGNAYHARAIKSDYRANVLPVIKNRNIIIQILNVIYLRLISRRRRTR